MNKRQQMTTPRRTRPVDCYTGTESAFQKAAIKLVRSLAKCDSRLVTHIPNGGQRTIMAGARLKAEGVVKGYPDIMVFTHGLGGIHCDCDTPKCEFGPLCGPWPACGLALELKVWPNKPGADQEEIHRLLASKSWRVEVCYGLTDVEEVVRNYFG